MLTGIIRMKVKYLVSALSENFYIWLRVYDIRAKSWHTLIFSDANYMKQLIKSGDKRFNLEVGKWRAVPFNGEIAIEIYAKQRDAAYGRRSSQKAAYSLVKR